MAGWIILAVVLLILIALLTLPVSLHALWQEGLTLRLGIGPASIPLYPPETDAGEQAENKAEQKKETDKTGSSAKEEGKAQPTGQKKGLDCRLRQIQYSLETLPPVLRKALRRARRKLVVDKLRLQLVFGGEDPADAAMAYGRAQAAANALFPLVQELLTVRKSDIRLSLDFQQERTVGEGELLLHARVGSLLWIGLCAAGGLLRWYTGFRKIGAPEKKEEQVKKTKQAHAA